jgi:hypothetical protein
VKSGSRRGAPEILMSLVNGWSSAIKRKIPAERKRARSPHRKSGSLMSFGMIGVSWSWMFHSCPTLSGRMGMY